MGGHGGLNILPQKRWNVYNFENREKVKRDEEAAAKEEQLKREQARKRDSECRLEQLRAARGLAHLKRAAPEPEPQSSAEVDDTEPKTGHINLFEGIRIFDPVKSDKKGGDGEKDGDGSKKKKIKKEEAAPRIITPEDEKYRLGYGLAGKGVKLPWYLEKRNDDVKDESNGGGQSSRAVKAGAKKSGKKTLEELREERLKREKREKERELALRSEKYQRSGTFLQDKRSSRW